MLLRAFFEVIFPPLCHVCRSPVTDGAEIHLCASCRDQLVPIGSPLCTVCGEPFATEGGIDHRCGTCLTSRRPFDAARAPLVLAGPAQELIHRFKYGGKVHLRRPLALLTARELAPLAREWGVELLVPVPLHARRLRERGFNQAVLLGESLGRAWRLPLARRALRRVRWTEPQAGLSAAERAENIRGAFAVAEPARVAGRRVLLVDDVYTTGSTVTECARELKRAGATAVFVVTVARAP